MRKNKQGIQDLNHLPGKKRMRYSAPPASTFDDHSDCTNSGCATCKAANARDHW